MLDLYCLDGAEARTIQRLKSALRFEQGLAIESISFEPLKGAPEELINFSHQGVDYGPSLPQATACALSTMLRISSPASSH